LVNGAGDVPFYDFGTTRLMAHYLFCRASTFLSSEKMLMDHLYLFTQYYCVYYSRDRSVLSFLQTLCRLYKQRPIVKRRRTKQKKKFSVKIYTPIGRFLILKTENLQSIKTMNSIYTAASTHNIWYEWYDTTWHDKFHIIFIV